MVVRLSGYTSRRLVCGRMCVCGCMCDCVFVGMHMSVGVCVGLYVSVGAWFFFDTIFVSSHMYPENPEGTQNNRRLNEHGT